ncbi:MAG: hypothetical protein KF878_25750 [Planctomycetes bacterium]|nr:hypothetical protein [Planctomycetota bacterium]
MSHARALSPAAVRLLPPAAAAALSESGRLARARDLPPPPTTRARACERQEKIESGRLQRGCGRRRLLPFDLVLTQAQGALPLFRAGPFDELRLFQRRVTSTHDTEWVQRAAPGDLRRERFEPFAVFRLRAGRGEPVPALGADPRLVGHLRQALGTAGVLAPRRWLHDAPGEQRLGRPGASPGEDARTLDAARGLLDDRQRIAWLESAFSTPPADGAAVHRYYLGGALTAYVVRHDAAGKRLFVAEAAAAARGLGLLVYVPAAA